MVCVGAVVNGQNGIALCLQMLDYAGQCLHGGGLALRIVHEQYGIGGCTQTFLHVADQYIGSNVQAKTKVVAVRIPKDVFLQWVAEDRELNRIVMQRFARWIVMLGEYGINSASLPLRVRMAKVLDEQNTNKPNHPISKEMVCGVLATSMRSTNRIIKQFKEEGIIAVSGDDIRIIDLKRLQEEAQE